MEKLQYKTNTCASSVKLTYGSRSASNGLFHGGINGVDYCFAIILFGMCSGSFMEKLV